jgi:exopolysaccharide biosynthesis glucuronosyltransferase PssD
MESKARGGKRVMAVASGGGHWIQLMRLRPALEGHELCFVCTNSSAARFVEGDRFHAVMDANRTTVLKMAWLVIQVFTIVLRFRPEVVITTGAASGYWACRFGRMFGARTLWLDSVANAEVLSMSGQKAGKIVDCWLTQWEHLADSDGPDYRGSVL